MNTASGRMVTILGPTASGKTSVAVALAAAIDGEIISADSRQVYRGMDIGTGKDLDEYVWKGRTIPYHLIDIAEPGSKYNLYEYQHDFQRAYKEVLERRRVPVLCGGSGLYLESVLKGYELSTVPPDMQLRKRLAGKSLDVLTRILQALKRRNHTHMHNTTDVDTAQRAIRAIEIEYHNLHHPLPKRGTKAVDSLIIGINIDRDERRKKISDRLKKRLDEGMVDEITKLLDRGIAAADLVYYGLEYKYVTEYVTGMLSYDEMFRQLEIAIHQFAKRQMTWFRGMERRGFNIHWIEAAWPTERKVDEIRRLMAADVQAAF